MNRKLDTQKRTEFIQGIYLSKNCYIDVTLIFKDIKAKLITIYWLQEKVISILCSQVALGNSNELLDADYNADQLPSGKHSTKGLGQIAPDPNNYVAL